MRLLSLIPKLARHADPTDHADVIEPDATEESTAYLIVKRRAPLAVASTPAEARQAIRIDHDGTDGRWGSHFFTIVSDHCGCGLTEAQLARLNGHGTWAVGTPNDPYWLVVPVPAAELRILDTFRNA
ncbi:hypothetical protein ABZ622_36135 [Streptomyces sp. NPDC007164]|uniref:hypothetical protein n=1 Tax=Streptomyces sp. NPDC007164 TaxID=3156918 RepID=UPI0033FECC6E